MVKKGDGEKPSGSSEDTEPTELTDLPDEILAHISGSVKMSDASRLVKTTRVFQGIFPLLLIQRRQQEYNDIRQLLERYSIPMPLNHPVEFKVNLIKSASIVEKQIRNIDKWDKKLLYERNNLKYLFYNQLPLEDITADSLNLALKYFNNTLAIWLIRSEDRVKFKTPVDTLNAAARSGNLELVKWLVDIERGADRLRPDHTTLIRAAESGNLELVKWLVDIKGVMPEQMTLGSAAESGNLELVQWLIHDHSLTPGQDDLSNALKSGRIEMVSWLVDNKGIALNEDMYEVYIKNSADSGAIELLQWLIDKGVTLNINNVAINSAALKGNLEMVQWLTDAERGDDMAMLDHEFTLDNAARSGSLTLTQWLLTKFESLSPSQNTLDCSAGSGNIELVRWLMAMPDIDGKSFIPNHRTLCYAAKSSNLELVKFIVNAERDGDRLKPDIHTLNYAASSGSLDLIKYIINEHNIIPNALTKQSAVSSNARSKGDVVKWLSDYMNDGHRPGMLRK